MNPLYMNQDKKPSLYKLADNWCNKERPSITSEELTGKCKDCDGSGITIETTQGCCGNCNEDGSCCGYGVPTPYPKPCVRCQGTGKT